MECIFCGYSWAFHDGSFIDRSNGIDNDVLYAFKTNAKVNINGTDHAVDLGDFLVVRAGTPHCITAVSDFYILHFIEFKMTSEEAERLSSHGLPLNEIIHIPRIHFIEEMILDTCYCAHIAKDDKVTLNKLTDATLYHAATLNRCDVSNKELHNKYPEIEELRKLIFEDPARDWTIKEMCRITNYSPSMMQRKYKQMYNVSCMDEVISSRISHAQHLLSNTSTEISQIAKQCGFNSYEHFCRTFKKRIGKTPNEFRNEDKA